MPTHRTPLTKQQVGVFVSGYQVTYGRRPCDEPFDALREISGLSNNVNLGFSGDGVWISPTFSEDENQAISGFDLAICQDIVGDVPNLAPGSGEYRVLLKQEQPGAKITQMAIYRSNRAASTPPAGWDGISSNLNTGRKGAKECLYIVTRVWRGPFISAVVVSHAKGSSMPLADTLRPIDGGSPNINHGFDGQCVYLTPIYTSDPSQAARGFEVRLTTSDDSVGQDLSWGASGKPRWLVPTMGDFSGSRPMTHVELVRSEKKLKVTDAMTGNINEGRGGDFLYLRWPGA
ncbi:hypothetical protein BKA62DRAFT_131031 [Auriculariales sp. MPI-PUGE-AT-0066]|nr:hypothetical protein BKA62DRAFT_131031 [Auriculariales sp. MPI-PUGE-AT-0066]